MKKLLSRILFFVAVGLGLSAESVKIPLVQLKRAENIVIDNGQILITEFPTVHVYDLKRREHRVSFGKEGEGPREFFQYARIQQNPSVKDQIIDGHLIKEIKHRFARPEFTAEHRQRLLASLKQDPRFSGFADQMAERFEFPSRFPSLWTMVAANKAIYLLTYENKGKRYACECFDFDGATRENAGLQ